MVVKHELMRPTFDWLTISKYVFLSLDFSFFHFMHYLLFNILQKDNTSLFKNKVVVSTILSDFEDTSG